MKIPRGSAILGWHFISPTGQIDPHGRTVADPDALVVVPGETYSERRRPIKCCENGLHSSVSALDALVHAPGPYVCRVASWGEVDILADKMAASRRRVLRMGDASAALRRFSAWCALETPFPGGRKLRDVLCPAAVRKVRGLMASAGDEPSAVDHVRGTVSAAVRERLCDAEAALHALGAQSNWSSAASAAYMAADSYAWRAAAQAADCARMAARDAAGPGWEFGIPPIPGDFAARNAACAAARAAQEAELTRLLFAVVGRKTDLRPPRRPLEGR